MPARGGPSRQCRARDCGHDQEGLRGRGVVAMTPPARGATPLAPAAPTRTHGRARTAGTPDVRHPSLMELAELDEGLLDEPRSAAVEAHVTGCAECTRHRAELRAVGPALSAAPAPHLPAAVAARLDAVLAGEVDRRERRSRPLTGGGGQRLRRRLGPCRVDRGPPWATSATTGPGDRGRGCCVPALAAAVAAAVVGFGAYVVSASAGLNEPPVVAAVSSAEPGRPGRRAGAEPGPGPAPVLPGLAVRAAGDQRPDRRHWPAPPSTGPRRCWCTPGRARPPW